MPEASPPARPPRKHQRAAKGRHRRSESPPPPNAQSPSPRLDPRYAPPRLAADALRRAAPIDLLHASIHRKLILVSAAAGYGKTSLLAAFALESDSPVAWLNVKDDNRDVAALAGHIAGALQTRFPNWRTPLLALAAQPGITPGELGQVLAREMAAVHDDYFVLILDDIHLAADEPAALALLEALIGHLPEQAHLIMAGRSAPPLNYSGLAEGNELASLDEAQLRFTAAEVQALLRARNQGDVPLGIAQELVDNTEGWITGILLTSHLRWRGLVAKLVEARESNRPVFDYLAAEVLELQPPELQQFLLESAVLPEMEPDVCDAVLERADSAARLSEAEARRLFVSAVGDEAPAYQFHHLFRDFLRARLRTQAPDRLCAVQTQAARWYGSHHMPEAAVTFYVQAGNLDAAAQLAESEARRLYDLGRFATLRQWAEQLASVSERAPRLYLFVANADMDSGQLNRALAHLDQADAGFAATGEAARRIGVEIRRGIILSQQGEYDEAQRRLEAAAAQADTQAMPTTQALALRHLGNCYFFRGQLDEAERALNAARELWAGANDHFNLALTLVDLSGVYRARAKSTPAEQTLREALELLRQTDARNALVDVLNNIGWDMYLLGQFEAAMSSYDEAIMWARRTGIARRERSTLEGQADILADLGDLAGAAALYHQLLQQADRQHERHILIYACCGLARIDRRSGSHASALEWVRRAEQYGQGYRRALPMANVAGLRGILQVEMGDARAGLAALQQAALEQEQAEAFTDLPQTLLFSACAEFRLGQAEAAAQSLERAFSWVAQIGSEQMLLREVPLAADLLEGLRDHPVVGDRASALLDRSARLDTVRARLASRGVMEAAAASPAPPPKGLEIHTLGGGRVAKDGLEIPRSAWTSQRPRELFFFLVDRMPVARDQLLATFWLDMPQPRAMANLYQTLYRLRKALGADVVVLEPDRCRAADGLTMAYDAATFETEARAALAVPGRDMRRLGDLDQAARRYAGDYLPDVDTAWADERRRNLRNLFLVVLQNLADERMQYTQYSEARAVLERALLAEPLRDDFHRRMLLCLGALGRRHEVVDHYRRYRETLRSEMGLDPPPDIRELYSRLIE